MDRRYNFAELGTHLAYDAWSGFDNLLDLGLFGGKAVETSIFRHDTNIASGLTAFVLTQFNEVISADKAACENRTFVVSHMEPFACHLDIRLIDSPA